MEYKISFLRKVWTVNGHYSGAVPRMESVQVRRYSAAFNQLDVREADL